MIQGLYYDIECTFLIRINLDLSTRDMVLKSRHADHHTAKEIKIKMLASLNGASEYNVKVGGLGPKVPTPTALCVWGLQNVKINIDFLIILEKVLRALEV